MSSFTGTAFQRPLCDNNNERQLSDANVLQQHGNVHNYYQNQ